MAKVLLKFNNALVKELLIVADETTIGRRPENDLVIDNPAVSGRHCRILKESGQFFVEDLNSTNGTYMRDRRIAREALHHKDEFAVAKHTVQFENEEEELPAPIISGAPVSSDATMVMSAPRPATPAPAAGGERVGHLRIIVGDTGAGLVPLTQLTTYIGKSDRAQVKLRGLFAPDLAACVAKKQDGDYLTALQDKMVKLNGDPVMEQVQVPLKEGDLIDVGPVKMMYIKQ